MARRLESVDATGCGFADGLFRDRNAVHFDVSGRETRNQQLEVADFHAGLHDERSVDCVVRGLSNRARDGLGIIAAGSGRMRNAECSSGCGGVK